MLASVFTQISGSHHANIKRRGRKLLSCAVAAICCEAPAGGSAGFFFFLHRSFLLSFPPLAVRSRRTNKMLAPDPSLPLHGVERNRSTFASDRKHRPLHPPESRLHIYFLFASPSVVHDHVKHRSSKRIIAAE